MCKSEIVCPHDKGHPEISCNYCMEGAPYKVCCRCVCGEFMMCLGCTWNSKAKVKERLKAELQLTISRANQLIEDLKKLEN